MAISAAVVGAVLPFLPGVQAAEFATHDIRFRARGPVQSDKKVVLLAIDSATEEAWPEPRAFWGRRLAQVVDALNRAGASRIGLDIILDNDSDAFLEAKHADEDFRPDIEFAKAYDRSKAPLWLATRGNGDDWKDSQFSLAPAGSFRWASAYTPYTDLEEIRNLASKEGKMSTLAFACAGEPARITGRYWIDYAKPDFVKTSVIEISAVDLLAGKGDLAAINGAVVLIGETHMKGGDLQNTPFGRWHGSQVQAEAIRTLLNRTELRVTSRRWAALFTAVLGGAFGLLGMSCPWSRYALAALLTGATYSGGAFFAFTGMHWMLPLAAPVMVILLVVPLLAYPVREIQRRFDLERSEADRARIRARWGQMIDDRMVQYVEEQRDAGLGALRTFEAAFLYLDVADFSLITNRIAPAVMLDNVNRLFEAVVPLIHSEEGIVISFTGDGLSSGFDPIDGTADHRQRALKTALRLLAKIDELNSAHVFEGGDWRIRIGLGNGEVTLALVGGEKRQTVSFYGAAVNLTSRLEQAGKEIGASLVMSEVYGEVATAMGIPVEPRTIKLKGWADEIRVWILAV